MKGSFKEWLCEQTLSNDINHLFGCRNVFKALVRRAYYIAPLQGDVEKSVKTGYEICLKIDVFSPVDCFLHLSDSFLTILGRCLPLSSKLLGRY